MSSTPTLSAIYTSPSEERSGFTCRLAALPATPTASEHLGALREAVQQLQGDINTFLTQKMEDEKQRSSTLASRGSSAAVDESKEEANYGEEQVED